MKNKYVFVTVMLVCILVVSLGLTTIYIDNTQENRTEDGELTVVTSFYPMYVAAQNVIGDADGVTLANLSEPQTGCLHDYQLTPADMQLLSKADVFIVNGGGIETFLAEVASAYPSLTIVEASEAVHLLHEEEEEHEAYHADETDGDDATDADGGLDGEDDADAESTHDHDHDHGDENAHAWMSVSDYRIQVATIAEHLSKLDPAHAKEYAQNAAAYDEKLAELAAQQEELRSKLAGQKVILFHEAYAYVAEDYGMDVVYVMDLDEERQVSAGEVADVLGAIENDNVKYILAEETYGSNMGDTVQRETDVKVLYLDALNRGDYAKDSYLTGMQANIDLIREAFQ